MSETSTVTGPIVKALNQAGYFAMRLNSGSAKRGKFWIQLCPAGTADVLVCPPNRLPIWIETKAVKKESHKEQVRVQGEFRAQVEALGHTYLIARSLDDVLEILRGISR